MSRFAETVERLQQAQRPVEVFGPANGAADEQLRIVKSAYRRLAKVVHADVNGGGAAAHEAMVLLNRWLDTAFDQIRRRCYGAAPALDITIASKRRNYTLIEPLGAGDLCDLYRAAYTEGGRTQYCIAKIVRDAVDNPVLAREASLLRTLVAKAETTSFTRYFLEPLDSFAIRDGDETRRVLMLPEANEAQTLAAVQRRYPAGVELRHMVWMWKRVLSVLGFVHRQGVVHGAVLPPHILVHPADHGAYLIGWMGASTEGRATVISAPYAAWYPPEVRAQQRLLPATDIYLAAKCAIALLGGDPAAESFPAGVPERLQTFIKSCLFSVPARRPQDAWQLHAEFDETIVQPIFGAPKFIEFTMA